MKTCLLALLLLACLLGGCTTFGEIQKSEPIKTLVVADKSPEKLANCSLLEAKRKGLNATVAQQGDKQVLLLSRTYINDIPFAEITYKPQDKGTFIEIRAFNGYGVKESWAMDCVIPCASPPTN